MKSSFQGKSNAAECFYKNVFVSVMKLMFCLSLRHLTFTHIFKTNSTWKTEVELFRIYCICVWNGMQLLHLSARWQYHWTQVPLLWTRWWQSLSCCCTIMWWSLYCHWISEVDVLPERSDNVVRLPQTAVPQQTRPRASFPTHRLRILCFTFLNEEFYLLKYITVRSGDGDEHSILYEHDGWIEIFSETSVRLYC